jgi:hypothetical protein
MPLVSQAYPSKYINCADLQNRQVRLTIESVESEIVGQGSQSKRMLVTYFREAEKGLGLNKTNANTIAGAYGDNTDNWLGHQIILVPSVTDFQGRTVDCVRIRIPSQQQGQQPNGAPRARPHASEMAQKQHSHPSDSENPAPSSDNAGAMDDEIPF